jgi:hypothetical protein
MAIVPMPNFAWLDDESMYVTASKDQEFIYYLQVTREAFDRRSIDGAAIKKMDKARFKAKVEPLEFQGSLVGEGESPYLDKFVFELMGEKVPLTDWVAAYATEEV